MHVIQVGCAQVHTRAQAVPVVPLQSQVAYSIYIH